MKRKILALMLTTAMLATCLVGCGGGGEEAASEGEAATEEGGSDEKVTLTLSHLFVEGESFHDIIPPSVEQFNKDHPEYEIIIEEMPQDAYLTQTNARGTADDLAEIVLVNGTMMKAFSDTGVICDLTETVENIGIESILKDGLIADGTNIDDGVVYSLPIAAGTYGFILYNEEIFTEVGIDKFPETLPEFTAACDKLVAAGYTPMGLGLKDLWASDSLLFSAFANNYVGNEWFNNIRKHNGEASYEDPEYIAALQAFQDLAKAGYFNEDFTSISNDERLGLYLNKKIAMVSAGDWECKNVCDTDEELGKITKAAAWPGPAEGAKAENSIVQSAAWGIALGSKITDEQKVAAEIYLKDYFFTQENGRTMIEKNNEFVSWIVDEYDDSALSVPAVSLQEQVVNGTGCMNWDASADPTVKEIHQRGLQDLLMGSVTAEELAAEEQAEYEMILE